MEALKEWLVEPEGGGSYKEIQHWITETGGVELCCSAVQGPVRYDLEAESKSPGRVILKTIKCQEAK